MPQLWADLHTITGEHMIEVLKQAIEALEYFDERAATINEIQMARPVLLHLRQAIKELESQEPVAWVNNFIEGGISIGKRPSDLDRHPDRWTALYKDPKPCPTCEALCRTVMLDQTSHDTTPPQRTEPPPQKKVWTFWDLSGGDITDAIKAKIKEKNQ